MRWRKKYRKPSLKTRMGWLEGQVRQLRGDIWQVQYMADMTSAELAMHRSTHSNAAHTDGDHDIAEKANELNHDAAHKNSYYFTNLNELEADK